MLRVGLTGGIACGKSAVAAMMRELGCQVLEADKIAQQLVEPGKPAYAGVVAEFGRDILNPDGRIDRAALAKIVFADPARLARLNAAIHPFVEAELERQFERIERQDPRGVAVVEAALLVESGYYRNLDRLIVVWCRPEQQIERLIDPAGRAMPREQAERRIAAQTPQDEKRKLATDEIDGSTTLDKTLEQVTLLVENLKIQAAS